jgi:hypothetical protein
MPTISALSGWHGGPKKRAIRDPAEKVITSSDTPSRARQHGQSQRRGGLGEKNKR